MGEFIGEVEANVFGEFACQVLGGVNAKPYMPLATAPEHVDKKPRTDGAGSSSGASDGADGSSGVPSGVPSGDSLDAAIDVDVD